jgi:hypothetical protein
MPQENSQAVQHQVGSNQPSKPTKKLRAKKAPAISDMVSLLRLLEQVATNVGVDSAMRAICEKVHSGKLPLWRCWTQGPPHYGTLHMACRRSEMLPSRYELAPPSFLSDLETRGFSINDIFARSERGIPFDNGHTVFLFASRTDAARFWPWPDDKMSVFASADLANVRDTDLSPIRRGPKGYEGWELFQSRFYLNLYDDDVPANASINIDQRAEELMLWGQNHPDIGEEKTPGGTAMREKVKQWARHWPLLKARVQTR